LDTPNVTTAAADDILATSAVLGGSFVYRETANIGEITEVGVAVKLGEGAFVTQAFEDVETPFSKNVTGLTAESTYSVKAYVEIGDTKYYGEVVTFDTPAAL